MKKLYLVNLQKNIAGSWQHVSRVRQVAADSDFDLMEQCRAEYKALEMKSPGFRVRARQVQVISEEFLT